LNPSLYHCEPFLASHTCAVNLDAAKRRPKQVYGM